MDFTNEFRVSLPVEPAWDLLNDVERIAPCMPGALLTGVDGDQYTGTVKVKVGPVTVLYQGTATVTSRDVATRTMVMDARGKDSRGQGNANAQVTASLTADGDGTKVTVATHLSVTGKVAQFGKGVIEDISRKLMGQFAACVESKLAEQRELAPLAQAAAPAATPTTAETAEAVPVPAAASSVAPAAQAVGAAPTGGTTATQTIDATATQTPALPQTAEAPAPAPTVVPISAISPAPGKFTVTGDSAAPLDLMSVARGALLKRLIPVVVVVLVAIGLIVWLV